VKAPPSVDSRNMTQQFQYFWLEDAGRCSHERQMRLGTLVRAGVMGLVKKQMIDASQKLFGARAVKQH